MGVVCLGTLKRHHHISVWLQSLCWWPPLLLAWEGLDEAQGETAPHTTMAPVMGAAGVSMCLVLSSISGCLQLHMGPTAHCLPLLYILWCFLPAPFPSCPTGEELNSHLSIQSICSFLPTKQSPSPPYCKCPARRHVGSLSPTSGSF